MKMKEVLERTGLTDRAVRLYIANGLVSPECSRGYTGRNNYDFSETDVEILQKIALLRKADCSLEQIRAMQEGGEAARAALAEYLEEKREEFRRDGLILEALAGLPGEEAPDLDELCRRLTEGFRSKQVPQSDLKPTWKERMESIFFLTVSFVGALFYIVLNLAIKVDRVKRFPFPKFFKLSEVAWTLAAHLLILIPAILLTWVFMMYCKRHPAEKKRKRRLKLAGIFVAVSIFLTLGPVVMAVMMVDLAPLVYSETENPDNYMVLGSETQETAEHLRLIFPQQIPDVAYVKGSNWYSEDRYLETTLYYYRYRVSIDQDIDIFAQWVLPEEKFAEEVQRVRDNLADRTVYERQWGEWVCLSLSEADFENVTRNYYHYFFAYNEKTKMVRYVYSYTMDSGGISVFPYFLTLDWES